MVLLSRLTKTLSTTRGLLHFVRNLKGIKRPQQQDYLIKGLKPVIYFGRLTGLLSRSDVVSMQEDHRKITFATVHSAICVIFFFLNFLLQTLANMKKFYTDPTTAEKLNEFKLPGYTFTLFFIYTYFLFNTKNLRILIRRLQFLSKHHSVSYYSQLSAASTVSSTYPRFCLITFVGILSYGIMENVIYDYQNLVIADSKVSTTVLKRYYNQNLYHWHALLSENSVLVYANLFLIKCGTYAWVLGDILVIVLSRAVTEKLKILNDQIAELLSTSYVPVISVIKSNQVSKHGQSQGNKIFTMSWDQVRDECYRIFDLVLEMEKLVSPLILSCYGINVYLIVINLFFWISPTSTYSEEQTVYNYFAFIHFSFRVSSVTYFVADVYHKSNSIIGTLQRCPNATYTLSMERLERSLVWNPCGISLFGTFMITRKFLISIISFLFTTEIVLLQTSNSLTPPQNMTGV